MVCPAPGRALNFLDSLKDVFGVCFKHNTQGRRELELCSSGSSSTCRGGQKKKNRKEKNKGFCGFYASVPQHAERCWLEAQSMGQIWTEKLRFSKSGFQRGSRALLHSSFVFHNDFAQFRTLARISASVAIDCNHNNLCDSE